MHLANSSQRKNRFVFSATFFVLLCATFISISLIQRPSFADAQTADELQTKIDDRKNNIKNLELEIQKYQKQIDEVGKEADSLKNTITGLDLSKKKLEADLEITQNKIDATSLEIKKLSLDITKKENNIGDNKTIIAQSLAKMYESGGDNGLVVLLREKSLSQSLTSVDNLLYLQSGVKEKISELQVAKATLETNKKKTEQKKAELVRLNNDLSDQRTIIANTVAEKNRLLADTKNTEANYKKTLANRVAQKDALEKEISEYESAIKILVDAKNIPHTGTGVLSWPLDKITITQYFGNTPFATANAQIYNGKGHTGVDFRASIGTPIKAALDGTIVGVGNTDVVSTCYSYGKWVMIKHPNGLSTLYAHMSLQNVSVGQEVATGQVLGYSGNTGYTTGPHLHFGVYATQGVQITKLTNSKNCRGVTIPLADPSAYLNPLSFL